MAAGRLKGFASKTAVLPGFFGGRNHGFITTTIGDVLGNGVRVPLLRSFALVCLVVSRLFD
jgi:hypothetical protein